MLTRLGMAHRELAATQARQLGLLDPSGPGSWTHPDLTRLLHADGKVISPLFSGRLGDERVDQRTGAVHQVRYEPDASLHFEGGGTAAFGTKFVLVAARSAETRGRIILDVAWVPSKQQEAAVAMQCFARLRPLVPGAQGVIYDTALRGVHHQTLLRELGLLPINRVSGSAALSKEHRSARGRYERTIHIEDRPILLGDGSVRVLRLVARGGAIGLEDSTGDGSHEFVELRRIRTLRFRDNSGLYRWYNEYILPELYGRRPRCWARTVHADGAHRRRLGDLARLGPAGAGGHGPGSRPRHLRRPLGLAVHPVRPVSLPSATSAGRRADLLPHNLEAAPLP
jgi:hypothetical protein